MANSEVLILPYKKKGNHREYLIKNELIENWDPHPDICSISIETDKDTDYEIVAKEHLEKILNVKVNQNNLYNLGVCSTSKKSQKFYYLYCINISNLDYKVDESKFKFVKKEEILKNIDSQLIVAYSRLEHLYLV